MEQEFSPSDILLTLGQLPPSARYWVAYSGGTDSHALLAALAALRPRLPASELRAVHVNHGLREEATAWQRHCERVCESLGIAFESIAVKVSLDLGESVEAAARAARYQALRAVVAQDETVLTAHTRDDQAETVLLQLTRGAGTRGLAAMPRCAPLGSGWLARPLLDVSRAQLAAYVETLDSAPIQDPSNEDRRFDRNFIRHEIMPPLTARWPSVARSLARVAVHQAEASFLATELAAIDLPNLRGAAPRSLSCRALNALGPVRRRNALRVWIKDLGFPLPSAAQLHQIESGVLGAAVDRVPLVRWPGTEVRRYRDGLHVMAPLQALSPTWEIAWVLGSEVRLPHGRLQARRSVGSGLAVSRIRFDEVSVRLRRGGEKCRPAGRLHRQSLKKLFQSRAVPPWKRDRLPLLFAGDELVAVAGEWVCEPYAAKAGEPALRITWIEDSNPP